MSLGEAVWDREGRDHTLSRNTFNLLLCGWTGAGIASSAIAANVSLHWPMKWQLLLGTFLIALIGVFTAMFSKNPVISLLGYAMVTIPFGLMLGPVVALYTAASVVKVFAITVAMVAVLGVVGAVIPESLEGWAPFLFGGLVLLLLASLFVPIAGFFGLPVEGALTWLDWLGVFLFGGYVIFDFNRAQHVERTVDNSIDCALAVYLDFANLFIRLLSIMGNHNDD